MATTIKDITATEIKAALKILDRNPEVWKGRESKSYDLIFEGKQYPPILVLSEANKILGGEELILADFKNSTDRAFNLIRGLGFEVITKESNDHDSFHSFLVDFINVSDLQITGKGTTEEATAFIRSVPKKFRDLEVEVSFGIGRATAIPWISFLTGGQKTSNGIYPVYLYFKNFKYLILAYGISEKQIPALLWNVEDAETITDFFQKQKLGAPSHYGNSLVFMSYSIEGSPLPKEIGNHLEELINIYKQRIFNRVDETKMLSSKIPSVSKQKFDYKQFHDSALGSNLFFSEQISLRFVASLAAKPFLILTGLSGSGKTKIAQAFVSWISIDNSQICIVPVGADWTNREPLLGFPNALKAGEYIKPDNGVLDLIIAAKKDVTKPYFLILDEMNLSHVERYFADFLSVMESSQDISLHSGTKDYESGTARIPSKLNLPKNIFIIGTVNIDETTYMFSPKVLDRANVIEFRVSGNEMQEYLNGNNGLNMDALKGAGANMAENFVEIALNKNLEPKESKELSDILMIFFKELKRTGTEFGYRTASEIKRFAAVVNLIEPDWTINDIMDAAIMQKLLPKLHGSRSKLNTPLTTLAKFCITNGTKDYEGKDDEFRKTYFIESEKIAVDKANKIIYPLSFEKLARMHKNVIENGFTSYAEA